MGKRGRPRAKGLQFYPRATALDDDAKAFIAAFENDGRGFLDVLWENAYGNGTGKVILRDFSRRKMFARECFVSVEKLEVMANEAATLGLIDVDAWQGDQILTSSGIINRLKFINKKRSGDRSRKNKNGENIPGGKLADKGGKRGERKEKKTFFSKERRTGSEATPDGFASGSSPITTNSQPTRPERRVVRARDIEASLKTTEPSSAGAIASRVLGLNERSVK